MPLPALNLPPIPDHIPPCPFCGQRLVPCRRNTGASHPTGDCTLAGWFIGAANLPRFGRRQPLLAMEIVDGHPIFNTEAKGRPVTIEMVNQTVAYYKEQAK